MNLLAYRIKCRKKVTFTHIFQTNYSEVLIQAQPKLHKANHIYYLWLMNNLNDTYLFTKVPLKLKADNSHRDLQLMIMLLLRITTQTTHLLHASLFNVQTKRVRYQAKVMTILMSYNRCINFKCKTSVWRSK